jgi:hypothetical protein
MMRKNLTTGGNHITKSEVGNNNHHVHNKNTSVFLFSVIALSLVSLSLLVPIANAQTPSNSTPGFFSIIENRPQGVRKSTLYIA